MRRTIRNLQALSEVAGRRFRTVDITAGSAGYPNIALTIHDEQYRATVAALEQNIRRTEYLLPLPLLLGLGIGFLVRFLSTRSGMCSYALMRPICLTRVRLFFSILAEQAALPALAAAAVAVATGRFAPAGIDMVCYLIGCCAAVLRAIRVQPLEVLREQE